MNCESTSLTIDQAESTSNKRKVRDAVGDCVFSFGLIGDCQYATDLEKGLSYFKDQVRYYQDAINKLKKAVICWNKHPELNFCVNLGDLLDARNVKAGSTATAYRNCEKVFEQMKCKRFDILGNHEFYNWPTRAEIPRSLNISQVHPEEKEEKYYYSYKPVPGWRMIILDSFAMSAIEGSPNMKETLEFLKKYNPNDLSIADGEWYKGVKKEHKHMVPYNGGLGSEQLSWLEGELADMVKKGERGFVFTHVPIARPEIGTNKIFDSDEAEALLIKYRCIKVVFTGHIHDGFYFTDEKSGIHHYGQFCPIVAEAGDECHSIIRVYNDRLVVEAFGKGSPPKSSVVVGERRVKQKGAKYVKRGIFDYEMRFSKEEVKWVS